MQDLASEPLLVFLWNVCGERPVVGDALLHRSRRADVLVVPEDK